MVIRFYQRCEEWLGWIESNGVLVGFVTRSGELVWEW